MPPLSVFSQALATQPPGPAIVAFSDLSTTWGVALVGVIMSATVYGVTCIQTLNYFTADRTVSDARWVKSMVAVLFVLDTLHQALIMHFIYYYLVDHITDSLVSLTTVWSLALSLLIAETVMFLANVFFVRRIWRMSKSIWMSLLTGLLTFASFVTSIVYSGRHLSMLSQNIVKTEVILQSNGLISYALSAGADVTIMATMIFFLLRNRTGFRKSDKMLFKAATISIATGALTCVFELAKLIAYIVSPTTLYVLMFHMVAAKLYINALLTALNSREFIGGKREKNTASDYVNTIPLSRMRQPSVSIGGAGTQHERGAINILVKTHVESDRVSVIDEVAMKRTDGVLQRGADDVLV